MSKIDKLLKDCKKDITKNVLRSEIKMSKEERIEFGDRARQHIMTYCSKENSVAKLIAILK